jgi:hydroxypyruvate isomerase
VAHVHLADAPGRHEPGSGAMDWQARLAWLDHAGYRGRVGLEYRPQAETLGSLAFRNAPLPTAE